MKRTLALLAVAALAIALGIGWEARHFAVSVVPGWHTPILAPFAVAHAAIRATYVGAIAVGVVLAVLIVTAEDRARGERRR